MKGGQKGRTGKQNSKAWVSEAWEWHFFQGNMAYVMSLTRVYENRIAPDEDNKNQEETS